MADLTIRPAIDREEDGSVVRDFVGELDVRIERDHVEELGLWPIRVEVDLDAFGIAGPNLEGEVMDDEVTESVEPQSLGVWIDKVVVIFDRLPPRMHVARDAELLANRGWRMHRYCVMGQSRWIKSIVSSSLSNSFRAT
jgi:hypothetical protein